MRPQGQGWEGIRGLSVGGREAGLGKRQRDAFEGSHHHHVPPPLPTPTPNHCPPTAHPPAHPLPTHSPRVPLHHAPRPILGSGQAKVPQLVPPAQVLLLLLLLLHCSRKSGLSSGQACSKHEGWVGLGWIGRVGQPGISRGSPRPCAFAAAARTGACGSAAPNTPRCPVVC